MWHKRVLVSSLLPALAGAGLSVWTPVAAQAATVKVAPGDNLTAIAARYHTTVAALVRLNGLRDQNRIVGGQSLTVPDPAGAGGGTVSIVVSPGQSLTGIAARYHTTVGALVRLNRLRDGNRILAGQRLTVPLDPPSGVGPAGRAGSAGSPTLPGASHLWLVPLFERWGAHYGVSVPLLEAVTWWESGWQEGVVSSTGAVGIGQLEPSTVADLRVRLGDPSLSARSTSDNIRMSAAFLAHLMSITGGNRATAVAAYYQGLASVQSQGALSATRHYVQGILAYERIFAGGV